VIDLFGRVPTSTRVVVRSLEESLRIEGPLMANRGIQLPAFYGDSQRAPVPQAMVPEEFYGNPAAQGGVTYIPDETDIYMSGADGQVVLPSALPTSGVEMVGAGFEPVVLPNAG
jgi:hypothetical protein